MLGLGISRTTKSQTQTGLWLQLNREFVLPLFCFLQENSRGFLHVTFERGVMSQYAKIYVWIDYAFIIN